MEQLDIHLTSETFKDYFERFEIRAMTKEDDVDVNIVSLFLTSIGKEAYSHDRKPDVVLIDADFTNDPLLCNDILSKFKEATSEEFNFDVISNIICPHNAFVSCGKLVQCEAHVLNEL
ncbi:unnamed protein product [Schistosoma curassoni]|uniref:DUF2326 domain-containing protein n=1 Tax=Schistosoma curassoni TaxID=6186 RepID=A0A183JY62_9TREM|nr:unnamed protein product [Schistosoma curassoni]